MKLNPFTTTLSRILIVLITIWWPLSTISAQIFVEDDPDDAPAEADTNAYSGAFNPALQLKSCPAPFASNLAIVHYDRFVAAYMTLSGMEANKPLTLSTAGQEGQPTRLSAQNGDLKLENLVPNQIYQLKSVDACGQTAVIAVLNTYPYKPGGNGIEVSTNLYKALAQYVAPERQTTRLDQYLQNIPDVSLYEKIEFAQKFFMGGNPLPADSRGVFPANTIGQYIAERGKMGPLCECEYIFNQDSYAKFDKIPSNLDVDDWTYSENGKFGSAGRWWTNTVVEGPARMHNFQSDGWKNGSSQYTKLESLAGVVVDNKKSPFYARLSYHLLCVNFPNALPENCNCSREVRFEYDYATKLKTRATTRNSLGVKRSFAMVQDYAVAVISKDNVMSLSDVQILDAGLATAKSECNAGLPASVIQNGANIISALLQGFQSLKSGNFNATASQIQVIGNNITDALDKIEKFNTCNSLDETAQLLQGTGSLTLKGNEPVTIAILAGSVLKTGGKRSWDSQAKVESSFFLNGVTLGGFQNSNLRTCCSDYSARWIYASQFQPDGDLQGKIAAHIFKYFPNSSSYPLSINGILTSPGNIYIPTEIGFALASFESCQRKVQIINPR